MTTRERLAREECNLTILGERVSVRMSPKAREHLAGKLFVLDDPNATISHLVQSLAVSAAGGKPLREAATDAKMSLNRWVVVVALASTGYSSLGLQLERARRSRALAAWRRAMLWPVHGQPSRARLARQHFHLYAHAWAMAGFVAPYLHLGHHVIVEPQDAV
jgi:hypothetical protein